MMSKNIAKRTLCIALVIIMSLFCGITAFAVDADGDGIDDDVQQYTDAATDPITDAETFTETEETDPEPETEVQTEPETEAEAQYEETTQESYEYEEEENEYIEQTEEETQAQYVETLPTDEEETEFQTPTLAKTVSTKTYSTSYLAGFISWICVIAGVITVAVVLISTSASGRKSKKKQRY